MKTIDTENFSAHLREKAISIPDSTILITNYAGSEQEKDLTEPANCQGFGRIRHFRTKSNGDWCDNPLPILPAAKYLKLEGKLDTLKAQVFQNAVCNWRCWYCFVDFSLLSGNPKFSSMLSCDELVELYLSEENRPIVIDLSGGQPDLVPEWVPWMMDSLEKKNLLDSVYLWSDDNLSNDYFWKFLSKKDITRISQYKNYGRVCCFKGFDEVSFQLNTKAAPSLFHEQFNLFEQLLKANIDLYGYVTLTCPPSDNIKNHVSIFMDKLQSIHPMLPLKVIPLKIQNFGPVKKRKVQNISELFEGQEIAYKSWQEELYKRFTVEQRSMLITDFSIID